MSRARYDNRQGYQSFFGNEAIKYGKQMHNKFYGEQEGCVDWDDVKGDYNRIVQFADKSAGARTITVKSGAKGALANKNINIGGREYKTDAAGDIRLLEKDWMQNEINVIQERQKFLNETAKSIIWGGDRLAVQILGVDAFYGLQPITGTQVQALSAQSTGPEASAFRFWKAADGPGNGASETMMIINAQPSHLRCLPSASEGFSQGLNKILFILDRMNIAFDQDVVHAEKVGAPIEHVAKTAPASIPSAASAI